jgi:hypothetical protein
MLVSASSTLAREYPEHFSDGLMFNFIIIIIDLPPSEIELNARGMSELAEGHSMGGGWRGHACLKQILF